MVRVVQRLAVLLLLAATVAGVLFVHGGEFRFIHPLALALNDYKTRLAAQPQADAGEAVVVAIDEKSVRALGRWPWDRAVMAELFRKLRPAQWVGVDIVFAEKSTAREDALLAQSLRDADNVVAGFFFRASSTERDAPLANVEECALINTAADAQLAIREYRHLQTNIDPLQRAARSCATFTTEPDMDGIYRAYKLGYVYDGLLFPTLATQLYQLSLGESFTVAPGDGGAVFNYAGRAAFPSTILLNFSHPPRHIPAVDLLRGVVPPESIEGRLVLLGATEEGIYDLRPTPVGATTAGVDIHYTALLNLLRQDYFVAEPWDTRLLILLMAACAALSLMVASTRLRLAVYLLALAAGAALSLGLQAHQRVVYDFYWLVELGIAAFVVETASILWLERDSRFMRKAFASYVSGELVEAISRTPEEVALGGEEKEITVLFSDMRNFTAISESLRPQALVAMLNDLFEPTTRAILDNRGMLDKYIGDAIMAIFNAPVAVDDHADCACAAALAMTDAVEKLAPMPGANGERRLAIGIGVNTGLAVVGNMGSTVRFSYTAIGDSVNLASRLEGLTKYYGVRVLISEATRRRLTRLWLTRKVDRIVVKGKSEPIDIHELMVANDANRELATVYEQALGLYAARRFVEAEEAFGRLAEAHGDGPSRVLQARSREFCAVPPGERWQGEHVMTSK
jgi:adenylate cyclase